MQTHSRRSMIQQTLIQLNWEGQFIASVLTDGDGLPLASVTQSENQLAEMVAAVAPLVQRIAQRTNERTGLPDASEVVINTDDGSRLICRFFMASEEAFILVCVVPGKSAYRRVMNQMVRTVQKTWSI